MTIKMYQIRESVANYMQSEGCKCCEGGSHDEHKAELAKLLEVPMYPDNSGWNFDQFATKPLMKK